MDLNEMPVFARVVQAGSFKIHAMADRIHDIWGERTPYADGEWPGRPDQHERRLPPPCCAA